MCAAVIIHALSWGACTFGKAEAVLSVLEARGLEATEDDRQRILSCSDLATLERWLRQVMTAASVSELSSDAGQ